MKRYVGLILVLLAAPADAASLNLVWDPSPGRADGTPAPGLKYAIHQGATPGGPYTLRFDAGAATTYTVNGLAGGQSVCFVASAYLGDFAAPTEQSVNSNEVCTTIPLSPISPPGTLRLSPAAVSVAPTVFGSVALNASPLRKTVSIKNISSEPFVVTSLDVMGGDAGNFIADIPIPTTVNPSGTATVATYFKPDRIGWHEAELLVSTDAGQFAYRLTGNGTPASTRK